MPHVRLGNVVVGEHTPPYLIAEVGVNHEGSLDLAKELVRLAKAGGANAVKFQTYKAESLASRHSPAYWDLSKEPTTSQYALFKKYDALNAAAYVELARSCREEGIDFVSTPFDDEAVDFLAPLMPFFKVASADITNLPFLQRIGAYGKPVVLSTGASTLGEIDQAVHVLSEAGSEVALLHCILNYPTPDEHAHLGMITGLRRAYPDRVIGYSDHTLPREDMLPLVGAYLLGARIIEKHFTNDKTLPGNDHYHAMDVDDLKRFKTKLEEVRTLLGPDTHKQPIPTEDIARRHARRSLVITRALKAGEALQADALTYKRPGTGISPSHWDEVIGRRIRRDLAADHVLQWEDLLPDGAEVATPHTVPS